jgi:hypothetical protein
MRKGSAAEWMLARAAGDVRGVAIYGDLLELAATRGRVWFWMAYVRTLVALTWRTPAAFACGTVVFAAMYQLPTALPRSWWRLWTANWIHHLYFVLGTQYVVLLLWFLLPFIATRCGLQDRLVRLLLVVSVIETLGFLAPVVPLLAVFNGLAVLTVVAAISSKEWRGAGLTLAGTMAVSVLVEITLYWLANTGSWYYNHHRFGPHFNFFRTGFALERHLFWKVMWMMFAVNAVVLALVSKRLRARFMQSGRAMVA